MESAQLIPNDLLRNVILPNVYVRTLVEACTRVCLQWNKWITPKFWETVFKTQFGKVTIQIIPPITNLNYRRMCIEASQVPPQGTVVTLTNNCKYFSVEMFVLDLDLAYIQTLAGALFVEDVIYCTSLKMRKTLTAEVLELEPEFFRPMIKPGTNGHPPIREGIRVFGRWKKQSYWSGTLKRVNEATKEVDIHWEDDDKGTIGFDEVYSYPTEEEVLALRKQITENTLDPKTHVFASRTDLAKSGRCGPYHEGTMDHLSCHWTLLLSGGQMVPPTSVTVKKQLNVEQVYSKIDNMVDKMLMGQKVLYKALESEDKFYIGEVSSDPNDFATLMVQTENKDEGVLELKVFYTIVAEDRSRKPIPADSIVRVSRPLIQDLAEGKIMYVNRHGVYMKCTTISVEDSRALVSYTTSNSFIVEQYRAGCMELFKPIIL